MKKLLAVVDWALYLTVGIALGGSAAWVLATRQFDSRLRTTEQSLCDTAFLLTRKSSDTVALVARQHACVRSLSAKNTNDPFPYDTLFQSGVSATR